MKKLIRLSLIIALFSSTMQAQSKFITEKGKISFVSNAQLEVIKANSTGVFGILDIVNNQFAFSVDIASFNGFDSPLQRTHFLESYMEAEMYPKGSFRGKIIEEINYTTDSTYEVRAKGDLDLHGIKQNRIIKGKIIIKSGILTIESHFNVPLIDHNIKIPKIVSQKIATEIQVTFNATMIARK